jgi:Glycosyl transferases group 1
MYLPRSLPLCDPHMATWAGASGRRYDFAVTRPGTAWIDDPAIYVLVKRAADGANQALYVGYTESLHRLFGVAGARCPEQWRRALMLGMTHVHLRFEARSERARRAETLDLAAAMRPVINEILDAPTPAAEIERTAPPSVTAHSERGFGAAARRRATVDDTAVILVRYPSPGAPAAAVTAGRADAHAPEPLGPRLPRPAERTAEHALLFRADPSRGADDEPFVPPTFALAARALAAFVDRAPIFEVPGEVRARGAASPIPSEVSTVDGEHGAELGPADRDELEGPIELAATVVAEAPASAPQPVEATTGGLTGVRTGLLARILQALGVRGSARNRRATNVVPPRPAEEPTAVRTLPETPAEPGSPASPAGQMTQPADVREPARPDIEAAVQPTEITPPPPEPIVYAIVPATAADTEVVATPAPVGAAPVDAVPVDAVPVDAVPVDAVPVDAQADPAEPDGAEPAVAQPDIAERRDDDLSNANHTAKRSLGLDPAAPVGLFASDVSYAAGSDILMEAIVTVCSTDASAQFVFAGEGALRRELEDRAMREGFGQRCRFLGDVPPGRFGEVLAAADFVLIPAREPQGEQLARLAIDCGKPVLTTHQAATRCVVHGRNGLVTYDNPGSFVWGIRELLGPLYGDIRRHLAEAA